MWPGYVQYAGNEVINVARTEAYAAHLPSFKPIYRNTSLAPMLGETYSTPIVDDAPWTDPDRPESYSFFGVYPLDVTGVEDSTRASTVTESTSNGGNPGRLRHGTKAVVFSALLIGDTDAAVAYGMDWLKLALEPGPCGPATSCSGDDLCFLSAEPQVDLTSSQLLITSSSVVVAEDIDGGAPSGSVYDEDIDGGIPGAPAVDIDGGAPSGSTYDEDLDGGAPTSTVADADIDGGGPAGDPQVVDGDVDGGSVTQEVAAINTLVTVDVDPRDCLTPLLRNLRNVLVTNPGPAVTSKHTLSDGAVVWTVTWTAVAGDPFVYGEENQVITGFLDPDVTVPWTGGVVPEGGSLDLDGALFNDADCVVPEFSPIVDPLCPAVVPPPLPPSVQIGCYDPPRRWRRRQITLPQQFVPLWGEVVPRFAIHARTGDVRNLRVRFYADVDGNGDVSEDPCAFCGDLLVSYVPHGFTLVFDAAEQDVYAFDSTQQRRSVSQLVFAADGTPFTWPVLTCGMGYVVTLDLPQTQEPPVFDLSLFPRVA